MCGGGLCWSRHQLEELAERWVREGGCVGGVCAGAGTSWRSWRRGGGCGREGVCGGVCAGAGTSWRRAGGEVGAWGGIMHQLEELVERRWVRGRAEAEASKSDRLMCVCEGGEGEGTLARSAAHHSCPLTCLGSGLQSSPLGSGLPPPPNLPPP